jgi:hypothetical protein
MSQNGQSAGQARQPAGIENRNMTSNCPLLSGFEGYLSIFIKKS